MSAATRRIRIGRIEIGGGEVVAVQSMCATRTRDTRATAAMAERLRSAGAGVVRIAVDNERDAHALEEIRGMTSANLAVDLQENWRLAEEVARHADKIRYNPGHLGHQEKGKSREEKVEWIVRAASRHGRAIRIGVNCGSIDPAVKSRYPDDNVRAMVESACDHCSIMDSLGFDRYLVSMKDSRPDRVLAANREFTRRRPDVPLHLGVTEAGLPPEGIVKTKLALEPLLADGIGDTIRVSLTLPNERKTEEVAEGLKILEDVRNGRKTSAANPEAGINIISCPSCSRVENESFVRLAEQVRDRTRHISGHRVTIAVMGCRVNGPGETDDADLGVWCGPKSVNLKKGSGMLGTFSYEEVIGRIAEELDAMVRERTGGSGAH